MAARLNRPNIAAHPAKLNKSDPFMPNSIIGAPRLYPATYHTLSPRSLALCGQTARRKALAIGDAYECLDFEIRFNGRQVHLRISESEDTRKALILVWLWFRSPQ